MKVSRTDVDIVLRQLMEQMQLLDEQILGQLQSIVNLVQQGAWQGAGANRFVDEIQQSYVTDASRIREGCQLTVNSILRSLELLDAADTHAVSLATDLDDLIRQIYI